VTGQLVSAISTAVLGVTASTAGLLAQAAAPDVAPWVSAGGATAAVGGLVYVARLLASGELVASPVADRERDLRRLVHQSERREERLQELLEEAGRREDSYHRVLTGGSRP
jgi:hypothetical protein